MHQTPVDSSYSSQRAALGSSGRPLRSVSFSDLSHLILFEGTNSRRLWSSIEDRDRFNQELVSDVQKMRTSLPFLHSTEDVYKCIGIERFVSASEAQLIGCTSIGKMIANIGRPDRRRHTKMIVDAQGVLSEDKLRKLSQLSSRASQDKAHKLALGYLELFGE